MKLMYKLRHFIRKTLSEAFGVVLPIDELADSISLESFQELVKLKNKGYINDKSIMEDFTLRVSQELNEKTLIKNVIVVVIFKHEEKMNKVKDASFSIYDVQKFRNQNVYNYNVKITLKLNWDFQTDITKELTPYFAHELHHVYDYILRNEKKSKSKTMNDVKSLMVGKTKLLKSKHPALTEFMDCFYFMIPEEINARVQEAYNIIKNHKDKINDEFLKELFQTTPVRDAKQMINFNLSEINKIPENDLRDFVNKFNESIESIKTKKEFDTDLLKYPKQDINAFFNFWRKRINKKGHELFFKITKMAGTLKNINEIEEGDSIYGFDFLFGIDQNLLHEIFNESLSNYLENTDYLTE